MILILIEETWNAKKWKHIEYNIILFFLFRILWREVAMLDDIWWPIIPILNEEAATMISSVNLIVSNSLQMDFCQPLPMLPKRFSRSWESEEQPEVKKELVDRLEKEPCQVKKCLQSKIFSRNSSRRCIIFGRTVKSSEKLFIPGQQRSAPNNWKIRSSSNGELFSVRHILKSLRRSFLEESIDLEE